VVLLLDDRGRRWFIRLREQGCLVNALLLRSNDFVGESLRLMAGRLCRYSMQA